MHDIGKIGITDTVLLKPGRYTPAEIEVMRRHPEIGYNLLSGSDSELLQLGALIAWTHHERYDGSGYPRGLKGEDIPVEGRITAIADVFDALTSARPYKEPITIEDALEMMSEDSGAHFDPTLMELFLRAIPEVHAILDKYAEA
jgi:putative two-component system response regulator